MNTDRPNRVVIKLCVLWCYFQSSRWVCEVFQLAIIQFLWHSSRVVAVIFNFIVCKVIGLSFF
jgi:hypothetical protein